MDDSKQIFVADTNNHRIVVFNHYTGVHIRNIGSQGALAGFLNSPYGVCVNKKTGLLYVADYDNNRVQVFNKDTGLVEIQFIWVLKLTNGLILTGDYERTIGSGVGIGEGQMNQPIAVCIDEEKSLLLVADYSNNRVQFFDETTGSYLRNLGGDSAGDGFSGPRGLCICKEANLLFVSDRENHRVKMFDNTTYALIRHLGQGMSPGLSPGEFNRPMEMCVSVEDGVLLVVDGYNHRVQIIELPELRKAQSKLRQTLSSSQHTSVEDSLHSGGSKLAATLDIVKEGIIVSDVRTNDFKLSFQSLGGLFNIFFPKSDLSILREFFDSASLQKKVESGSKSDCLVEAQPKSQNASMIVKQSGIFLSILDELAQHFSDDEKNSDVILKANKSRDESISMLLSLVTPSLFALKALLDQHWTPNEISHKVVRLLVNYLSSLDSEAFLNCGLNSADRERAIAAVVIVLKKAIAIHLDMAFAVFSIVFEKLSKKKYTERISPESSNISSIAYVPLAYLDIIASVIASTGFCCSFFASSNTQLGSYSNSDISCLGTVSIQQDVMSVIFGSVNTSNILTLSQNNMAISKSQPSFEIPQALPQLVKVALQISKVRKSTQLQCWDSCDFNPEGLFDLQIEFLSCCKDYFTHMLTNEANISRPAESKKLTRGGRNIWRKEDPLAVGDLVDCMDKEKCWFESMVHEVFPDNCVKIHFLGWGSKWDDLVHPAEIESRIAPLNTQTKNWRADLYEGGLIEIKCNDDLVNQKWMWGKVTVLNVPEEWSASF